MSRADDVDELNRLLARVSMHARLARVALKRMPDGRRDDPAWLDALDEVGAMLDVVTGVRVRFEKWSSDERMVL